ncbi:hypothetical protein TNIN_500901 [Trichonephila inaurata madagascariensis]|uniref:Uncharacterized protein n=1 Tax=Trichonephila inaurata madagascariensis TaxID=2747483 RepID=A0A8X6YV02_9ARAC|nr:hypothetical protein TNIN_500901 [Trichonephila inaurata madagascariensis]
MPDQIFFPLQLLQLEEATPSTTPYRDHYRGGPLRLPGGRKDALRESQKRNNEPLNGKRMLYVIKKKPFHFDFPTLYGTLRGSRYEKCNLIATPYETRGCDIKTGMEHQEFSDIKTYLIVSRYGISRVL